MSREESAPDAGSWSSGYDIALTQRRSPVRIRPSPSDPSAILRPLPADTSLRHADPKSAAFSRASALPLCPFSRSSPDLSRRFHRVTEAHGSPSRRASARPISRRHFGQSMKTGGSPPAAFPSLRRAASFVPSLPRPTSEEWM